ncbi:hypothetical protein [Xenorhabdus innexi]|uniref:C-type lysozyme inhibitor domain-containing protein n=1 Tax=Xenorhabdus innexi TaxID=290109 RepID=A0A2G0NQ65_9GAMM|nr:hypothetical protein [Xenorhabdus innexi]PHM36870.1 hypothetical protein Xinn_01404 [Xenorhabdus innexi]
MRYISPLITIMFLIIFTTNSAYAEGETGCPKSSSEYIDGYIGKIRYSTVHVSSDNTILFTLSQYPKNWMKLSNGISLGTVKGKIMFTLLLSSKLNFNKVSIKCSKGDVPEIILLDNNDTEEILE